MMDPFGLVRGQVYYDPAEDQNIVFYGLSWSKEKKIFLAVVHPAGDPDVQSCYGMLPSELQEPVHESKT